MKNFRSLPNRRHNWIALGLALALALAGSAAWAGTTTWTGTNNWNSATNWSSGSVPGTADTAVIQSGRVVLSNSIQIAELVVSNNAVLVFSNWDAGLSVASNVIVRTNATITHSGAPVTNYYAGSNRVFIVCSNLTLDAGGRIDVTGMGYAGGGFRSAGFGTGSAGSNWDSGWLGLGGGYGGEGGGGYAAGLDSASIGTNYGSLTAPEEMGSGGGGCNSTTILGGAGGGAIRLIASNLTVNGSIVADGAGLCAGGGSGGSIYLSVGTWTGAGTIRANGGAGYWSSGPLGGSGGGGGRIAIYYGSKSFTGIVSAYGGIKGSSTYSGGVGPVYLKEGTNAPELILDNGITSGMAGTPGTWISSADGSQLKSLTISNYAILKQAPQMSSNPAPGDVRRLELTIPTIVIASNGSINVSSKGYGGGPFRTVGYGPGGATGHDPSWTGCGGGYGGRGGGTYGGTTYGSFNAPVDLGSGGSGSDKFGGAGGGAVKLIVNSLTLDGSIIADGGYGNGSIYGGGSGGSVYILAGTMVGATTAVIRANGGSGAGAAGGGGGGRIAITVFNGPFYTSGRFLGSYAVSGGSGGNYGTAGSIFFNFKTRGTVVSAW